MSAFKNNDLVMRLHVNHEINYEVGVGGCTSINTVMEYGQMSGVPWFQVFIDYKLHSKWNGALVLGVEV